MIGGQLLAFARVHAYDIVRDRRSSLTVVFSFVALPAMFWGIDALVSASGGASIGMLRTGLPLVAATSFMSVAFILTTVPLVRYRSIGVLRTLSTTPARARAFLLGHVPIRAGLLVLQTAVILALATAEGMTRPGMLVITLLLGAIMILALGYLLAARLQSPDAALQLAYLIPMVVLATSGVLVPLDVLPRWAAGTFALLPTTWFVDAVTALIAGDAPMMPVQLCWGWMAAASAIAGCAALRFTRWG